MSNSVVVALYKFAALPDYREIQPRYSLQPVPIACCERHYCHYKVNTLITGKSGLPFLCAAI